MFFRYRRRPSLLLLLLFLFGFKAASKSRWTDEERKEYRSRARLFRSKLREACGVWHDDDEESPTVEEREDAKEN